MRGRHCLHMAHLVKCLLLVQSDLMAAGRKGGLRERFVERGSGQDAEVNRRGHTSELAIRHA